MKYDDEPSYVTRCSERGLNFWLHTATSVALVAGALALQSFADAASGDGTAGMQPVATTLTQFTAPLRDDLDTETTASVKDMKATVIPCGRWADVSSGRTLRAQGIDI